jgi:hypothetical protein
MVPMSCTLRQVLAVIVAGSPWRNHAFLSAGVYISNSDDFDAS